MFGKGLKLFKLFGFQVSVDASWLIIAVLITWSLAQGLFPFLYPDLTTATYWWMGVAGALGLFASIVVHELMHSLVARTYGLSIRGITLFIFGGVADLQDEPPHPRAEFMVAAAGPLASVAVGGLMWLLAAAGRASGWPTAVNGVVGYLAGINFLLVAFNLIPAFPLDGGRILRSLLWSWKRNLRWATRITSNLGSAFGLVLIILGVFNVLSGQFVQGMWWFLIGMFLRGAAQMSYRQLLVRQVLEGEPVDRFMQREVHTVSPETSLADFIENYVYAHHHKMFPVQQNGKLLGCVTTRRIKEIPREQWSSLTVGEIVEACSEENMTRPHTDAMKALTKMTRDGRSRLLVAEGDQLEGILTLKDLMRFISLKLDLEEDESVTSRETEAALES